ncbi:MAG: TolC family protein, partial [bacterium]|nr:TolC family protein [bacterium]
MKFLITIICCWALFLPGLAAENNYTLPQLIELAKKGNLLLKITELDKKIAVQEYRDTRALPNPEFEYSRGRAEIPGETGKPKLWSMGLKWPMPNPLHRYYYLKSMSKNITTAEIEAEMRKREIIKGLKNHYFQLRLYKKIN